MTQQAPHVSVMLGEVVGFLGQLTSGVIVDGTVGQGGHSEALLEATPAAVKVVGFDRDPQAVEYSRTRLERFGSRFTAFHCGYDGAAQKLASAGIGPVTGALLDLGLSSTQLGSERGFSFSMGDDQPLDMRFDSSEGPTAADVIRTTSMKELADKFKEFAQVPMSGRLARILKEESGKNRMETMGQFVGVCHQIYGTRIRKISSPTLPAQALRMMVNLELERLEKFFADLPLLLAPGGRLVAISFHSGEDRIVKHSMRALVAAGGFELPFRKAIIPGDQETYENARARSAKLRVLDRVGA
jgi:16S rRNA (cytosine1402-N4)-methyltransferase